MPHQMTIHNGIVEHSPHCDCLDCLAAWEDWQEAKYRDRLALEHIELRQAKPATDAEWRAFLEREFPRAETRS